MRPAVVGAGRMAEVLRVTWLVCFSAGGRTCGRSTGLPGLSPDGGALKPAAVLGDRLGGRRCSLSRIPGRPAWCGRPGRILGETGRSVGNGRRPKNAVKYFFQHLFPQVLAAGRPAWCPGRLQANARRSSRTGSESLNFSGHFQTRYQFAKMSLEFWPRPAAIIIRRRDVIRRVTLLFVKVMRKPVIRISLPTAGPKFCKVR